jgi:hypothetical protein
LRSNAPAFLHGYGLEPAGSAVNPGKMTSFALSFSLSFLSPRWRANAAGRFLLFQILLLEKMSELRCEFVTFFR